MQTEIRARTRVQFTNPILSDCLRRHAALFQYAGIEPDFDPEGCFFTVRDDLFPMPHTLSDFAPILSDCLRRHAALFQYAGIEPDFDPEGCFFTVRDDLFPMPHTLSDFAPCLVRFLAGYNDRSDAAALRDRLRAQGAELTAAYTALSIDQQAVLTGTYAARWNTRPTSYAKDYYAALVRRIAERDGLPLEAVTLDHFAYAVRTVPARVSSIFNFDGTQSTYLRTYRLRGFETDTDPLVLRVTVTYDDRNHVPARVSSIFNFDGTQSTYLRTYRLRGFETDTDPLVLRVTVTYDDRNHPRQAVTYDARTRPTAHRSMGTDFARQIGPKPQTLDFAGRHFVLTGGDKPALTRVIQSRGGIVATDAGLCGQAFRADRRRQTSPDAGHPVTWRHRPPERSQGHRLPYYRR